MEDYYKLPVQNFNRDLANLGENLGEIPGEFLAAEIFEKSSRDLSHLGEILVISPRSRLSRRVLVNLADISVISARSRKNLGEISARS